MTELDYMIDLHRSNWRQGPGSDDETRMALELLRVDLSTPLKVADIGCGSGAQTLVLAEQTEWKISAVDLFEPFLQVLDQRTSSAGSKDRIETVQASMDDLPFEENSFDLIWSEGAVYVMGFEKGISYWKDFLRPGGFLAVSEITWTTSSRPQELTKYWDNNYPEIDLASNKIRVLEKNGYAPLGFFILKKNSWTENYYRPLQRGFKTFLERHPGSDDALSIVESEKKEIRLYDRYKDYYSYGFYLAKRID